MKKLNIIIVNIILIVITFFSFDFGIFVNEIKNYKFSNYEEMNAKVLLKKYFYHYKNFQNMKSLYLNGRIHFRENLINLNTDKKPILILGCSFAYGLNIENIYDTLQGRLYRLTNRTVYNKAMCGAGPSQAIIMLQNGLEKEIDSPLYVIYIYFYDQRKRLFISHIPPQMAVQEYSAFFKYNKQKKLIEKNIFELYYLHSGLLYKLLEFLYYRNSSENPLKQEKFLLDHFLLMNDEIKEKFPESKFVIFVYDGDSHIKLIEKELKDKNIEIIYLSELSDINFNTVEYNISTEDYHPNAKAWEIITPLLVKQLGL